MIVIAMRSVTQKLVELTDASSVDWLSPMYKCEVETNEIGLIPMFMAGAPLTAIVVENLIACGAKVILFSTGVGAFQPNMEIGDFVIPSKAIIGEGTSKYYLPKKKVARADPEIIKILEEACKRTNVKPFVGSVWTTDAFYREMRSQVEQLQLQGVLGVEMETSTLYTVANFRQIKAGCLLEVSDSLANFKWEPNWKSKEYRNTFETASRILVESLKLLSKDKQITEFLERV